MTRNEQLAAPGSLAGRRPNQPRLSRGVRPMAGRAQWPPAVWPRASAISAGALIRRPMAAHGCGRLQRSLWLCKRSGHYGRVLARGGLRRALTPGGGHSVTRKL